MDQLRDERVAAARPDESDPLRFVRNEQLFGDLAANDRFAEAYVRLLGAFRTNGARPVLRALA